MAPQKSPSLLVLPFLLDDAASYQPSARRSAHQSRIASSRKYEQYEIDCYDREYLTLVLVLPHPSPVSIKFVLATYY